MENSAHLIYQQQNTKNASSKKAASKNTNANPLSALQDLAKHLGMHEMNKTLANYTFNAISNSLKKVSRWNLNLFCKNEGYFFEQSRNSQKISIS